jgi:putative ABC transport system permease protein
MRDWLADFRQGARAAVLKSPLLTAVTTLALSLGIGANTAVFSVVNAVLLRPLPFPESERLVLLRERTRQLDEASVSYPNFLDWREQNQVFQEIAIFRSQSYNLTGFDAPARVMAAEVSASLFPTLGVSPTLGRAFAAEDDRQGAAPVAVISHNLWRDRFGSGPDVAGKSITLDGKAFTVVGVMPARFGFPQKAEAWIPVSLAADEIMNRGTRPGFNAVARLKPGVTPDGARAEMETIARRLDAAYPKTNTGATVLVFPLYEKIFGEYRPALFLLLGAVGFVLLIACVNIANMLLARSAARQKEMALRAVLGASRLRLIRQLLIESLALSLLGGALGLLLAFILRHLIVSVMPDNIPRLDEADLDLRVLGFTFTLTLLTAILFGLVPALYASKPDLHHALKEGGGRSTAGAGHHRVGRGLVVVEVALALVLLIGAGLTIKSFARLRSVDLGLDPKEVLTMQLSLPQPRYAEEARQVSFFRQVLERVSGLPGVRHAGVVTPLPLGGESFSLSFTVDGRPRPEPGQQPMAACAMVSPDYFRAMGIPLLKGRHFSEHDAKESAGVAIIDEKMAASFWGNEDPIGKRIKLGRPESQNPWLEIVGVAGSVKSAGIESEAKTQLYLPYTQRPYFYMTLVVRTKGDPAALAAAVRQQIWAVDGEQSVYNLKAMNDVITESAGTRRVSTIFLSVFAAAALCLAAFGVYGVVAYLVTLRTREIGIRMALGARRRHVLGLVVGQGMLLVLFGTAAGVALAYVLTRFMSSLLYGVSVSDPVVFVTAPVLLCGVAFLANALPAWRAMKVDPITTLRHE